MAANALTHCRKCQLRHNRLDLELNGGLCPKCRKQPQMPTGGKKREPRTRS